MAVKGRLSGETTRRTRNTTRAGVARALRLFVLGACAMAAAACARDAVLLESDVPLPEGMTVLRSTDIRRARGEVTGGRFLLSGSTLDAADTVRETIARFESRGWTLRSTEYGLDHARAELAKGSRVAELRIDRRALDPAMSSGMLSIRDAQAATAER